MRKSCLTAFRVATAAIVATSLVTGPIPVMALEEVVEDEVLADAATLEGPSPEGEASLEGETPEEMVDAEDPAPEGEDLPEGSAQDEEAIAEEPVQEGEIAVAEAEADAAEVAETVVTESAAAETTAAEAETGEKSSVEETVAADGQEATGEPASATTEDAIEPAGEAEAEVTLDSQAATSGKIDGCTWTFSSNGTLTIAAGPANGYRKAGELSSLDSWASSTSNGGKVRRVVYVGGVKPSYDHISSVIPSSYNFPNITTIDVSGLDTSGVTSFDMMFQGMSKLGQVIGLDRLDTSNVDSMYSMFWRCTALKSVSLRGMDTSNVANMSNLFWMCSALEEVDFTGIDTSSVTDASDMFQGCGHLKRMPGFAGLDFQNVQRMTSVFQGCTSLTSISMPAGGAYATRLGSMFSGCTSLRTLDISRLDMTTAATQSYSVSSMFYQCEALTSITLGPRTYLNGSNLPKGTWYSGSQYMSEAELESMPIGSVRGTWKRMPFADVPADHWARDVIWRAVNSGLMSGYAQANSYEPRLFGTNDNVTRGQIAVILWNWAGRPAAVAGAKAFADVERSAYYYAAVRWASSVGVVNGYGSGTFGPNDNITREQLAVMLANYARNVAGVKVTGSASDYAGMSDADQVAPYARSAMGWCVRSGIISGSNGRLMPKGSATRAQTAKMVIYLRDRLG